MPDSTEQELTDVWRFVNKLDVTEDCFASHAAMGKPVRTGVDECRWASCSLFEGDKRTANMMKVPFYKRFVARVLLNIPAGSGRSLRGKNGHIDFWAYSDFEFSAVVQKVEPR